MVTAITAGYVYVVDSATGFAGGDPDSIDTDAGTWTDGTTYIKFNIYHNIRHRVIVERSNSDLPANGSLDVALDMRHDEVEIMFIEPTRTAMDLVHAFFVKHSKSDDNTMWLIVHYAANDNEVFYDASRNPQEAMKCVFAGPLEMTFKNENQYYDTKISFRSVFT